MRWSKSMLQRPPRTEHCCSYGLEQVQNVIRVLLARIYNWQALHLPVQAVQTRSVSARDRDAMPLASWEPTNIGTAEQTRLRACLEWMLVPRASECGLDEAID